MAKKKKEDKVTQAKKVLIEEETKKQQAFQKDLAEFCKKRGYALRVSSRIVLVPFMEGGENAAP